jgi:hypothetical protein
MSFLRIFLASVVSGALWVLPAGATAHTPSPINVVTPGHFPVLDRTLHHAGHTHGTGQATWCGTDFSSPSAQAVLQQIRADRAAGRYPMASKGSIPPDIGDRQFFNVSESDASGNNAWFPLEFELVDLTGLYYLWVEVAELANGNITSAKVASLKEAILSSSPAGSINPGQGGFANNNDIFGMPPNVDGDGFLDILMYDIGRGSGNTWGYVSSTDQLINPPDGQGNQRDILYLDSNEAARTISGLAGVAIHEYTHLIHLSYGLDTTFINEGLAEYSSLMNGYPGRTPSFISSPFEVSLPLFTWRTSPSNGGPGTNDYRRGGLFFTFIAEQHSPQVVGQIMKDTQKKGAAGIDSVLSMNGSSLAALVLDYHTANLLNDRSLDPRFGFEQPEFSSHRAFLTSPPIDGEIPSGDGESGYELQFKQSINAGSVHYLRISSVANVLFTYDTPDPTGLFYGEKVKRHRARLLLQQPDGTISLREVTPGASPNTLDGRYESVTFIMAHTNPALGAADPVSLAAEWTPLSQATNTISEAELPTASTLSSIWPNPFSGSATIQVHLNQVSPVKIDLYDVLGRHRASLLDGTLTAGAHAVRLDAEDLETGTYLVRMQHGDQVTSRTVTLVR